MGSTRPRNDGSESVVNNVLLAALLEERHIDWYHWAPKNGFLDGKHIDFVMYVTRKEKIIVLQVKSTQDKYDRHKKKYPKIPVILVCGNHSVQEKKQEIKNIIRDFPDDIRAVLDGATIAHIYDLLDHEGTDFES